MYRSKPLVFLLPGLLFFTLAFSQQQPTPNYTLLYQEIADTVSKHFYDQAIIEHQFKQIRSQYANELPKIQDRQAFGSLVNDMLSELKTSHTHLYQRGEPGYFQLADIFSAVPTVRSSFGTDTIRYASLGMQIKEVNQQHFIAGIFAGGPAEKVGLKPGDQIVQINGASNIVPILTALDTTQELTIQYRRKIHEKHMRSCTLTPEWINPSEEFLRAQNGSIQIIEEAGKKIGYIHIWSYAGQKYHDAFVDAVAWGQLNQADALIWDLRDGWGGASPDYLNIFNKSIPTISMINSAGDTSLFDRQWRKPVVMLINEGVRSGKEALAYGFKKYGIGPIVGTKTAGAVVAGTLR